jgi:LysM repeat protein
MKKYLISVLVILLATGAGLFAAPADNPNPAVSQAAPGAGGLLNNQYYLKSVDLNKQAKASYAEGDYDASSKYAEEAQKYAQMSDDWVALQLKIKETDDAIKAAKSRIDWADGFNAKKFYPAQYKKAQQFYSEAKSERTNKAWDDAIASAKKVVVILAGLKESPVLPAQYTVQTWKGKKDCLWNIAGRPWAYNNPWMWRKLYKANKSKLPDPKNPNIIEPGTVLNLPSVKGERRQGMWKAGKNYPRFK